MASVRAEGAAALTAGASLTEREPVSRHYGVTLETALGGARPSPQPSPEGAGAIINTCGD